MQSMTRRNFLGTSTLALAATGVTAPFQRPGKPVLRPALAAYSFRNHFRFMRGNPRPVKTKPMDMIKFIDFCADQDCAGAELTSYFFKPEITRQYLVELRRHAFLRGLDICGSAVGNNFSLPKGPARDAQIAYVKEWIDHCAVLGAPHIRVFAGREPKGVSREEADKWAIEALRECCDHAGRHGIFLGIENHDSIGDAKSLIRFVKAVDHKWFGVNLDTGNFRTANPYADMAAAAPFAVNVQLKVELKIDGQHKPADLGRVANILRKANYQGYVVLEYEAKEDPYTAVPPFLNKLRAVL
ncbi:MAG: xylose isomerase [Verrucomicrobiales bacterium]|nr:xylose isomerase [Verrucomicrobiales bacterium]